MNITEHVLRNDWLSYTLTNDNGMSVRLMNYGGILREIFVPDGENKQENVLLGYHSDADYRNDPNFFGAIVGRVAGRIADASYIFNGETINLEANEGSNHLHGGTRGMHSVVWDSTPFQNSDTIGVELTHTDHNGVSGYPGNVQVTVTYTLHRSINKLELAYDATTDTTTPLALTNHAYFNLSGNLKRNIADHEIKMNINRVAELNDDLIPTGKQFPVEGTPFDFHNWRSLKDGFDHPSKQMTIVGDGYDHYLTWKHQPAMVNVREKASGRTLSIETTQPGMVLYTGNGLKDDLLLRETTSKKQLGVCFETQAYPAGLKHSGFPPILLTPSERYQHRTTYTFGTL